MKDLSTGTYAVIIMLVFCSVSVTGAFIADYYIKRLNHMQAFYQELLEDAKAEQRAADIKELQALAPGCKIYRLQNNP